jgi:hypothetical protein
MRRFRKTLWITLASLTVFIFACVTINIYFPAEKVESVADDIVNEIREKSGEQKDSQKNGKNQIRNVTRFAFLCPVVWAEEATEVSNATIRALKEKIIARHIQWKPYFGKGMIKEGDDGYVRVAHTDGLNLKQKSELKKLVKAENEDRKSLYEEVAKALKVNPITPEQIDKIARIFAEEWQE